MNKVDCIFSHGVQKQIKFRVGSQTRRVNIWWYFRHKILGCPFQILLKMYEVSWPNPIIIEARISLRRMHSRTLIGPVTQPILTPKSDVIKCILCNIFNDRNEVRYCAISLNYSAWKRKIISLHTKSKKITRIVVIKTDFFQINHKCDGDEFDLRPAANAGSHSWGRGQSDLPIPYRREKFPEPCSSIIWTTSFSSRF